MNAFVIVPLIIAFAPALDSQQIISSWPNDFGRILTVADILEDYEKFVGKNVIVRGVLTTTHTSFQLWDSRKDAEMDNYEKCIDVSMVKEVYNKRSAFHMKYVFISGPIFVLDIPFVDTGAAGGLGISIESEHKILIDKHQGPDSTRSIKQR